MAIEIEAAIYATLQDVVDHKIECAQSREFISENLCHASVREMLFHALDCDLTAQVVEHFGHVGDQTDVGAVSFVARTTMRNFMQSNRVT